MFSATSACPAQTHVMKRATLRLAPLLLAGCAAAVPAHGVEGPVKLGQVAYVGGPRVRPDLLIEDSRCPVDVQCIWAGRVVLRATVLGGNSSRQIDLTLGAPVSIADGQLTLLSVEPQRTSGQPLKPEQIRFRFAFQGGL